MPQAAVDYVKKAIAPFSNQAPAPALRPLASRLRLQVSGDCCTRVAMMMLSVRALPRVRRVRRMLVGHEAGSEWFRHADARADAATDVCRARRGRDMAAHRGAVCRGQARRRA